jgi:PAS domain S-box-containing protein
MAFDLKTLLIILTFSHLMQVIVFYYQYKVNKFVKGPGWWLLWSAFEALGFSLIILRRNPAFEPFVIATQDIALILGLTFLCVGMFKFFDIKIHRAIPVLCVVGFSLLHWFFQFVYDDINIRSLLFSICVSSLSFSVVFILVRKYWNNIQPMIVFNAAVMTFHGAVFVHRTIVLLVQHPGFNLFVVNFNNMLQFFDALVVSVLWTYGFIMMLNEKLNADITEAKEHFENLFDTSPDAITITRLSDATYVSCNESFTRLSGFSKENFLGRTAIEINIWQNLEDREALVERLSRTGTCENFETQFRKKDGEIMTGLISAKLITFQGIPHLMLITRDISSRKNMENALRESEQRLQFVLQGSQLGFWDWNLKTGEVKRNARWAEMLGYSFGEIDFSLRQWTDLIHPDDFEAVQTLMKDNLEGRQPMYRIEYRMRCKDGSYKWILDQAKVVERDADGKPLRMSGTHSDISMQKNIQEELTAKNHELQEINFEKNRFFSIIAHDLKSPFLGFLGLTNIMAEEAPKFSTEELTKFGREINQTAQNIYKLLKNLLEWSQMQQGILDYQPKDLLLPERVQNIVETVRNRSEQKGIRIIDEITIPYIVYADERMTDSILLNLISNAVKFTHKYGAVTISAKPVMDRMIEITISDTGIGMSETDIEKLFKVGEKVRTIGTDGELSTGLGLLLCKEFVEKHGGEIHVESVEGKGSTFRFTLPGIGVHTT